MGAESILVVPRSDLFVIRSLQGFSSDPAALAHFLGLVSSRGRFVPRWPAEEDEALKQIVPYGVVCHGEEVFLFRRGSRGREAGLRGRWSVGLGGHVNPADGREIGPAMLEQALRRELAEEVALSGPQFALWGALNDDTDPVGRRHFGFVYQVWAASGEAASREPGKIQGAFVPLEVATARLHEMETWSQIVTRHETTGRKP